jgi:hypothetical protein
MRPRLAFVGALACLMAVSAACTGGGADDATSSRADDTEARADEQGPGCEHIVASGGRRFRRPGTDLIYMVDAVTEPSVCYDKISFVFDPGDGPDMPPGYLVEYREPPFVEGINTTTEGFDEAKAYLYVEMQPTSTVDLRFAGSGRRTYRGNLRLALDKAIQHTVIVEWLDMVEDVTPEDPTDDRIIWVIGLDEKRPFTVDSANQPPRINVLVLR